MYKLSLSCLDKVGAGLHKPNWVGLISWNSHVAGPAVVDDGLRAVLLCVPKAYDGLTIQAAVCSLSWQTQVPSRRFKLQSFKLFQNVFKERCTGRCGTGLGLLRLNKTCKNSRVFGCCAELVLGKRMSLLQKDGRSHEAFLYTPIGSRSRTRPVWGTCSYTFIIRRTR